MTGSLRRAIPHFASLCGPFYLNESVVSLWQPRWFCLLFSIPPRSSVRLRSKSRTSQKQIVRHVRKRTTFNTTQKSGDLLRHPHTSGGHISLYYPLRRWSTMRLMPCYIISSKRYTLLACMIYIMVLTLVSSSDPGGCFVPIVRNHHDWCIPAR